MSIIDTARAWVRGDIDPTTIAEVEGLIHAGDESRLEAMFSRTAKFGTAGLRELVGAGPGQLNLAVIVRATYAVGKYLLQLNPDPKAHLAVVGFDARRDSYRFAEATAGVLAAMGIQVRYFDRPMPTPLVAYALRSFKGTAGVVITASHNRAEYNGYKLYAENGAQIVSPADVIIAQLIEQGPDAKDIPIHKDVFSGSNPLGRAIEPAVLDDYFAAIDALRPEAAPARDLAMVYTPLHGVGYQAVRRAFDAAGFTALTVVEQQAQPNGEFPDLGDPNPEKEATLAKARATADAVGASLILANDPDADRLAVNVRGPDGTWIALKGNQIGILLADYQLARYDGEARPLVAYSIVSTPMIEDIAEAYGAHCETTLTGFKWVWNAAIDLMRDRGLHFVFGFEEALGYCAGDIVRDKDGVSAALLFAEMAAEEAARGKTVLNRLERLYRRHGLWVSQQVSVDKNEPGGVELIQRAMTQFASKPPAEVRGSQVTKVVNYYTGGETRPRWLENNAMVQLNLSTGARVLVRPSGTEPKLKIYVDLRSELAADADLWQAQRAADAEAVAVGKAVLETVGL